MPAIVDTVNIYAGDTVKWPTYRIRNDDGTLRDLEAEGWTGWRAQWRPNAESSTAFELTVGTAELDQGLVRISATPRQTSTMDGPGVWDLQAERNGEIRTWLRGKTKYMEDITR